MVTQTLDFMRDASAREATQSIDTTALLESLQTDFQESGSRNRDRGSCERSPTRAGRCRCGDA